MRHGNSTPKAQWNTILDPATSKDNAERGSKRRRKGGMEGGTEGGRDGGRERRREGETEGRDGEREGGGDTIEGTDSYLTLETHLLSDFVTRCT